jgi:hypothetical protein
MCVTMNFSSEPAPWMQCSAVFCNGPVLCCGLMCMAMGLRAVCVASVYPFIVIDVHLSSCACGVGRPVVTFNREPSLVCIP